MFLWVAEMNFWVALPPVAHWLDDWIIELIWLKEKTLHSTRGPQLVSQFVSQSLIWGKLLFVTCFLRLGLQYQINWLCQLSFQWVSISLKIARVDKPSEQLLQVKVKNAKVGFIYSGLNQLLTSTTRTKLYQNLHPEITNSRGNAPSTLTISSCEA